LGNFHRLSGYCAKGDAGRMTIQDKYNKLLEHISAYERVAIAFSGGVDSTFLCRAAMEASCLRPIAISLVSPFIPHREVEEAKDLAKKIGIEHVCIQAQLLSETVAANPKDRCYHCKRIVFTTLLQTAAGYGIDTILDGSNADDRYDYRPGMRALAELGIHSPLLEIGLGKNEIRELSKILHLPTWNKPSFACLASRIPYGDRINTEKLKKIEEAEAFLRKIGFHQYRVRVHGDIARIEVAPDERLRFFNEERLDEISTALKRIGFLYVAFELSGYRSGSMNRAIDNENDNITY